MATHSNILAWKTPWVEEHGGLQLLGHKELDMTEYPYTNSKLIKKDAQVYISSVQLLSRVQLFATHGLQHARFPCPSPTPRACSNSCPLSQWYHLAISVSVIPFSSCPQSFPVSGSFPMSQFFASGSQSIGTAASASVLPMNIQD